jgi:hypothetical protein
MATIGREGRGSDSALLRAISTQGGLEKALRAL